MSGLAWQYVLGPAAKKVLDWFFSLEWVRERVQRSAGASPEDPQQPQIDQTIQPQNSGAVPAPIAAVAGLAEATGLVVPRLGGDGEPQIAVLILHYALTCLFSHYLPSIFRRNLGT